MDNQSRMAQDNVNKEAAEPSVNQTKNIITSAQKEALHKILYACRWPPNKQLQGANAEDALLARIGLKDKNKVAWQLTSQLQERNIQIQSENYSI
jgi:hypothetical protein